MARAPRNNEGKTAKAMPEGKRFEPGNPGRPKGSRNKLGEAFIQALHEDFAEHGLVAIQKTRTEHPDAYVRVIAGLLPKEVKIETVNDLSDEQLDERIRQLAAAFEIGVGGTAGGAPEAAQSKPPRRVSPLH